MHSRDSFRRVLESDAPLLVSFDLNWCGQSRRLLRIIEQLPLTIAGTRLEVARVDTGKEVS